MIRVKHAPRRGFLRTTDGNVAIMTGFIVPVLLAVSAIGIDLASAYLQRRTAQSVVDLAAINAADHLDVADAAAQATLDANTFGKINSIVVTKGNYTPDPSLAVKDRFKAGQEPVNAVQVTLSKDARMYFARTFTNAPFEIKVAAIAGVGNEATFSVGSRLAALRGGIANQILNKLLGTSIELSVMDYEALASANVRVDDFLNAVNTSANLKAGTFSDVLNSSVTMNDVTAALAVAAGSNGSPSASALIQRLTGTFSPSLKVPLQTLIDVGPYAALEIGKRTQGLASSLSVLDILRACATIADGQHQIALNLNLGLPGITSLALDLAIGERPQHSPWVSIGQQGATVSTSQTKLRLVAQVLGSGPLNAVAIRLPLYLELAYADATLSSITCDASDTSGAAGVDVRPGIARAAIADVNDTELLQPGLWNTLRKAEIVRTPLLKVLANATVDIGNQAPTTLEFTQSDVDNGQIKRTNTTDIAASLVSSLVDKTTFEVSALGLINISAITPSALRTILKPVASTLDPVIADILKSLGISLGEADVRMHGIRCGGSNLSG